MGRRRGTGLRTPKPKPEYRDASDEVRKVAADLISKVHTHLAEASIVYLFRSGEWKNKGQIIFGTADKTAAKQKHLTGADFVITVNKDVWDANQDKKKREALLDHVLNYCGRGEDDKEGNPKWCKNVPMLVFAGVIRRHGLWTDNLQTLLKANDEYEQLKIIPIEEAKKTGTEG